MNLTRRQTLALGSGAALAALLPVSALAAGESVDDVIATFTGGATATEGGVDITAPEIAENGNTVPVEVAAEGASAIMLLAAGNPSPGVATFNFGPLSGSSAASVRIRLAKTQDLVAVARMSDGTFRRANRAVKVTIGGCGG